MALLMWAGTASTLAPAALQGMMATSGRAEPEASSTALLEGGSARSAGQPSSSIHKAGAACLLHHSRQGRVTTVTRSTHSARHGSATPASTICYAPQPTTVSKRACTAAFIVLMCSPLQHALCPTPWRSPLALLSCLGAATLLLILLSRCPVVMAQVSLAWLQGWAEGASTVTEAHSAEQVALAVCELILNEMGEDEIASHLFDLLVRRHPEISPLAVSTYMHCLAWLPRLPIVA